MNNKTIWFGIGGVVIGLLLAAVFNPFGGSGSTMSWKDDFGRMNSGRTMNIALDQHFIEQMIPHHDGAIAMAKLALEKSKRSEIKTLAQNIISAQETENKKMTEWYINWFGSHPAKQSRGMMGGGMMSSGGMHMGGQAEVEALASATDVDKAFIEAMIPHHQLAIMMAQMLKSGTDRQEMLDLAKDIIESQSAEIKQMQDWYKAWY